MVDEHAGELVADRRMDQERRDRGINPARKPADDALAADLGANAGDRLVLVGPHGPVAGAAGNVAHEIADQRRAVRGVHYPSRWNWVA